MTAVRLRIVDAFTDRPFGGNPAAVVLLDDVPTDEWMSAVARELNVSDTAFVIGESSDGAELTLRWFTPAAEIDLCGHATLASAHCLFEDGVADPIRFATRSGVLGVTRGADGSLEMDFPSSPPTPTDARTAAAEAIGAAVEWTGRADVNDLLLAVVADEETVRELRPDLEAVSRLDCLVLTVTAVARAGREYDFVSRVFAPKAGIPEDPVTGSSHTALAPFWAERLGRLSLVGVQVSSRSGVVRVQVRDERVTIGGRAVTVFDGTLSSAAMPQAPALAAR